MILLLSPAVAPRPTGHGDLVKHSLLFRSKVNVSMEACPVLLREDPESLLFALWNKRAGAVHTHSALYGTFTAHRSELLSRFIVPGGERSLKASAAPQPESLPQVTMRRLVGLICMFLFNVAGRAEVIHAMPPPLFGPRCVSGLYSHARLYPHLYVSL